MTSDLRSPETGWKAVEQAWAAWRAGELDRPLVVLECIEPEDEHTPTMPAPSLDQFLSIPRLRGIQWAPGDSNPSSERWLPFLNRIRDGGKLCQVYVSAEGTLTIVRKLGGRGLSLAINQSLTPEEGMAFLQQLTKNQR